MLRTLGRHAGKARIETSRATTKKSQPQMMATQTTREMLDWLVAHSPLDLVAQNVESESVSTVPQLKRQLPIDFDTKGHEIIALHKILSRWDLSADELKEASERLAVRPDFSRALATLAKHHSKAQRLVLLNCLDTGVTLEGFSPEMDEIMLALKRLM